MAHFLENKYLWNGKKYLFWLRRFAGFRLYNWRTRGLLGGQITRHTRGQGVGRRHRTNTPQGEYGLLVQTPSEVLEVCPDEKKGLLLHQSLNI